VLAVEHQADRAAVVADHCARGRLTGDRHVERVERSGGLKISVPSVAATRSYTGCSGGAEGKGSL
jgi:hypothetical protein